MLASLAAGLAYSLLPIQWLLRAILSLTIFAFSPVYHLCQFALLPITHLATVVYAVLSFPLRIEVLSNIETLYTYLGIAAILGLISGLVLYGVSFVLLAVLRLNNTGPDARQISKPVRTAASRRAARQRLKKLQAAEHMQQHHRHWSSSSSSASPAVALRVVSPSDVSPTSRSGLLSQTIIEEDSEF